MTDAVIELQEIPVMRVKADMNRGGPAEAMCLLESKLPTLKGRKFYGIFRVNPEGEEYYACVARIQSDEPEKMQLDTGVISGGKYASRKVMNWENIIRDGLLPKIMTEFTNSHNADSNRFSVEFYRSQKELELFIPLKER